MEHGYCQERIYCGRQITTVFVEFSRSFIVWNNWDIVARFKVKYYKPR
jgi:hypothetical protein